MNRYIENIEIVHEKQNWRQIIVGSVIVLGVIISLIFFINYEMKLNTPKAYKSNPLELRQMANSNSMVSTANGWFVLVAGEYESKQQQQEVVRVYAKVNNLYRVIQMPVQDVRVNIDNKIAKPYVEIEYNGTVEAGYKDEELIDGTIYKGKRVFVITCPESYLPERLMAL